ncbi:hypothetical protein [Microbacterium sp. NIBRBAC000506063]|uniref:hypothetical protein n=1 Tax=Microbacterium sp. NIBRBAC000506063 TaxID=2734618 RepID=UPI001CB6C9E3|nr:hypothetical protein [Microbacterium sp. NIBRBAC000506063]
MSHSVSSPASERSLLQIAGLPYFLIAFVARLPFAMMVVGVLTVVVSARGSLSVGGLTSAAVGVGTAIFGPLLGAAADRFGQRPVLVVLALANGTMLAVFGLIVYGDASDALVLLAGFGIGATAPQVAPMSRSRLVTMISERMPASRQARTVSGTMAYESAADEMVFVFGPFIVGLFASLIAPWAPLAGAAALTVLFVGAFALHPSGKHIALARGRTGRRPRRHPISSARPARRGRGHLRGRLVLRLDADVADGLHGRARRAGAGGLLYGVMGIGSALLALGSPGSRRGSHCAPAGWSSPSSCCWARSCCPSSRHLRG